ASGGDGMKNRFKRVRHSSLGGPRLHGVSAILAATAAGAAVAQQQHTGRDGLEEVLVTGSYIRRAADSASPLTIITQEDLSYTPRSSIAEILHADPAFNGSDVFTSFGTGMGTSTSA